MPKGGGVSDWHRQKRKKEQQKNKAARIAARDEKVKEHKTVPQVKQEIREMEKRFRNAETMPHAIKSKLDRLKKELKLVQQQEAEREAQYKPPPPHLQQQAQQPPPLSNPAVSIYYDPVLNPFGAPPPGQPRLFYRRGGGTTMNLAEAWVPGQPDQPVVAPPPPAAPRQQQQQQRTEREPPREPKHPQSKQRQEPPKRSFDRSSNKSREQPVPPPPPPLPSKEPPVNSTKPLEIPKKAPSLPPPSAAVQRIRTKKGRGGFMADIWASTEEVVYQEAVTKSSLQESTAAATQWWYRDVQHQIQGPFDMDSMKRWVQAGFFPLDTPVRNAAHGPFQPLQQCQALMSVVAKKGEATSMLDKNVVEEKRGLTVQDRIAALRQERLREQEEKEEPDIEDASVQARMAALRNARQNEPKDDNEEETTEPSVQDRIASLRQERLREQQGPMETKEMDQPEKDVTSTAVSNSTSLPPPPPPPPPPLANPVDGDESVPTYPVDVDGDNQAPVAPYPADDVPPYPMNEEPLVDVPYPVDDAYPAPYPVTDDYPVTEEYPVTDDYPATDLYPTEETSVLEEANRHQEPPKKKFKADKEVVSLLPSHLQKRRPANKTAGDSSKSRTAAAKKSTMEKDDYDRFMKEVEGL